MVDHPEQIKLLLATATSFNGQFYPKVDEIGKVNATLTKFLVIPNPSKSNNTPQYIGEFFFIEIKSSTLANLDIAISAFLGVQTDASDGYCQSNATYPFWIGPMDILNKPASSNVFVAKLELEARWSL